MRTNNTNSSVQLSLFPQEGTSVKDNQSGSIARVTNYLCTREALWRLLATYPKDMTVKEAVNRARVDFAKQRKEVAV
jgi:hypothetical protein